MFRGTTTLGGATKRGGPVIKRDLHTGSSKTQQYQKNAKQAIEQGMHQIVKIVQNEAKLLRPVPLFRMMRKQFVTTNNMFDLYKATRAHDNSGHRNRFSGSQDGEKGQSALYVGTPGNNGHPGQVVAEAAFYGAKADSARFSWIADAVERLKNGGGLPGDLSSIQKYFDPRILLPPGGVCIKFMLDSGKLCINLSDPDLQRKLAPSLYPALVELCLAYKQEIASNPEWENSLPPSLRREISSKREGEPLSVNNALFGSLYDVSQMFGNGVLGAGLSMLFESSRASSVLQEAYLQGSSNLVLPTTPGSPLPMVPTTIYSFDPNSRKIVSIKAEDGVSIEELPDEGSDKGKS
jgi:hypothetical protein